MTLAQVETIAEAIARDDARALHRAALAARLAWADEKDWKAFTREVNGGH
jgi:hypothetical protein